MWDFLAGQTVSWLICFLPISSSWLKSLEFSTSLVGIKFWCCVWSLDYILGIHTPERQKPSRARLELHYRPWLIINLLSTQLYKKTPTPVTSQCLFSIRYFPPEKQAWLCVCYAHKRRLKSTKALDFSARVRVNAKNKKTNIKILSMRGEQLKEIIQLPQWILSPY